MVLSAVSLMPFFLLLDDDKDLQRGKNTNVMKP